MRYVSTRGQAPAVSFEQAIFRGLAPDGGLYVPEVLPCLNTDVLNGFQDSSLNDISHAILKPFVNNEIPDGVLQTILSRSLKFKIPLVRVRDKYILELFHGPTFAFKDIAAQILPRFMQYFLMKRNQHITVLTATSGDTGGAVAQGFGGIDGIQVVILFPKGKVSKIQFDQLTHVAPNVLSMEIEGSFDDCQRIVKEAFDSTTLKRLNLTSANSINIGRLLPQMVYYAYATANIQSKKLRFVVPSGNMGNITAGAYAKTCGIPINSFLVSCNANDPVVKYMQTGTYKSQAAVETFSTAMDIGNPSNFERIMHLYNKDLKKMKESIDAVSVSDEETVETIQEVFKNEGYLLDPHTAVAWKAATKRPSENTDVIVATAHPSKFADEIFQRTGIASASLEQCYPYARRYFHAKPDLLSVQSLILNNVRS